MNEIALKIGFWYDQNKRDLPWRHTRDAYRIWLSEIILQQTRVVQGLDYYLRFVNAFPTVQDLAQAPLDKILKLWQGLGYYSRARNLHAAACQVGNLPFPDHYAELLKLKGVGPYTAAAIASFASDEAVAVVDGNVYRVLSRIFDIDTPIDSTQGQKLFQHLADEFLKDSLPEVTPSHHNQALMEFGALCCTPVSPQCDTCPVAGHCLALAHHTTEQRPVKQGKVKVRDRHLVYLIYIYKDTLWVHQRGEGDIWQGLWEFYLCPEGEEPNALAAFQAGPAPRLLYQKTHQLTHQRLLAEFWTIQLPEDIDPKDNKSIQALGKDYRQVTWMEWQQLAVPRLIDEANKRLSTMF